MRATWNQVNWLVIAGALTFSVTTTACDEDPSNSTDCPAGEVFVAGECVPTGDTTADTTDTTADTSDTTVDTADTTDTTDTAEDTTDTTGGPVALPVVIDDYYGPSGFFGDGEVPGAIVASTECPTRAGDEAGLCHSFVYTPGDQGFAGVFWQNPDGNWGEAPGLEIEAGATEISFYAWTAAGGETVEFISGYAVADGYEVKKAFTMTTVPTKYVLSLAGVTYTDVKGAFAWVSAEGVTLYVDDIVMANVPVVGTPGCTDATANNYNAAATTDDDSCTYDITFTVDLGCADVTLTSAVAISGPFCSWCGDGFELADDDNDDVWEGTFSFAAGALEFKYMANGFDIQEDLIGDGACAVITDGSSFANRQITVSGPATTTDTWGQCTSCGGTGLSQVDLPITFDDATVNYSLDPFEGAAAMIVVDPTDATNMVVETSKPDGAQPWAGTTVGADPGLASVIPFVAGNHKMNMRVWVPTAPAVIRLKVEEAGDPTKSVETETTATMAGTWQTLTFNFDNEVGGTAAFNDTYAYNQVSVFMAFGTDGTADGDAVYYFDDIKFGDSGIAGVPGCTSPTANNYDATATQDDGSCTFDVTFSVDMSCAGETITSPVSITGPFCGWCGSGFELADGDNDDVWEGTFSFAAGDLEFKYMANGFAIQEDLIGAGACAANTDGSTFANRVVTIASSTTYSDTWGQCTACGETVLSQLDLPITFDDATVDYALDPFEGAAAMIVVDPTDASNMVVETSKPDGAQPWAGTTVGADPGLASVIPFVSGNHKMNMRVWVPTAPAVIRLKVEEAGDPTKSVETETTATMAGAWQTLTFNFDNEVGGTAAFNDTYNYNQVSVFMAFGTDGTADGDAVYYFDDIKFGDSGVAGGPGCINSAANNYNAAATEDDGSCTFDVTFSVDMSCSGETITSPVSITGPFCQWCNAGFELSDDDNDDVWEGTLSFPAGDLEFKFMANGFDIQEDLIGAGSCAVVTDGSTYANRFVVIPGDGATRITATWGQCTACSTLSQLDLPITFDDASVDYALDPFEGAASTIVVDPTDATNMVVETSKPDGAQPWAGTTVGADPGLASVIPFVSGNHTLSMRVYVPTANTVIRMKVEEAADPTRSVETETTATMANTWQTLTFDFDNEVGGTAAFNDTYNYNQVSVFMAFGTDGTADGDAVYYFDDIELGEGSVTGPTGPTAGPAAPTAVAGDVISLFSDTYTDVTVDTWSAVWDNADVADVDLMGNTAKHYTGMGFAGIEFTSAPIDATSATHFYIDVWTAETTGSFLLKLVNFGGDGAFGGGDDSEHQLSFAVGDGAAIAPATWTTLAIPITDFTGLTGRTKMAQMVIEGIPSVYVDNVYFLLD